MPSRKPYQGPEHYVDAAVGSLMAAMEQLHLAHQRLASDGTEDEAESARRLKLVIHEAYRSTTTLRARLRDLEAERKRGI